MKFQGVVTADTTSVRREGENVGIIAWLAEDVGQIEATRFESLQGAYGGELEIKHEAGRVVMHRSVTLCSAKGLHREKDKLVQNIRKHLGVQACIQ